MVQRHCKSVTERRSPFAFDGRIEKVTVKDLTD